MSDEQTKFCSRCKTEKSISNFSKDRSRNGDLRCWCRLCMNKYQRDRRKIKSKATNYKNDRRYRFKNCYGITTDDYSKMFQGQDGYCALCGKCQSELTRCLDVDHNHLTGKVRGLLCSECNTGLGKFRVDEKGIELLEKAINYLKGDRNEDA